MKTVSEWAEELRFRSVKLGWKQASEGVIAEVIAECLAECGAKHPTMQGVACMLRPGHKGCHRHHTESSSFAWGK